MTKFRHFCSDIRVVCRILGKKMTVDLKKKCSERYSIVVDAENGSVFLLVNIEFNGNFKSYENEPLFRKKYPPTCTSKTEIRTFSLKSRAKKKKRF